jgi:hypothetical protein
MFPSYKFRNAYLWVFLKIDKLGRLQVGRHRPYRCNRIGNPEYLYDIKALRVFSDSWPRTDNFPIINDLSL